MGFYIEVPRNHDKAEQIIRLHGAERVDCPDSFNAIPAGKALICVVDNGPFEAAGYCNSPTELEAFRYPCGRPKEWLLMDKAVCERLCGIKQDAAE